jgi:hypothetical protein
VLVDEPQVHLVEDPVVARLRSSRTTSPPVQKTFVPKPAWVVIATSSRSFEGIQAERLQRLLGDARSPP